MRRQAVQRLWHVFHPASPSSVGCVGEWAVKEGVQCEWVIEGKMGEDNLGLSKLTVVRRALRLFITVHHFYSWHLNVRESGNRHRGTDSRREDTGGELKLRIMSRATEREASRNRVGNWCLGLWCVFPLGTVCVVSVYLHAPCLYSSQHWPAPPRLQIPPQEPRGSWFCPWKQRAVWEAVVARHLQGETMRYWNKFWNRIHGQ